MSLNGEVHVWYMTPNELAEYIKKHPIRPTKKEMSSGFDRNYPDWNWRSEKAAPASVNARKNNGR